MKLLWSLLAKLLWSLIADSNIFGRGWLTFSALKQVCFRAISLVLLSYDE